MINLLPGNAKKQIRAARTNAVLIRYIIYLGFAVIFLLIICGSVYIFLVSSKSSAEKSTRDAQSQINTSSPVIAQANNMRTIFEATKSILDKQISYSDIITEIGAVLPSGAVLDSLNLNSSVLSAPVNIAVHTHSNDDEAKLRDNLQKSLLLSSSIVQKATTNPSDSSGYPVTINVNLTANKDILK